MTLVTVKIFIPKIKIAVLRNFGRKFVPQSARICAIGGVKSQFGQCPNIHGFLLGGASLSSSPSVQLRLHTQSSVQVLANLLPPQHCWANRTEHFLELTHVDQSVNQSVGQVFTRLKNATQYFLGPNDSRAERGSRIL